MESIENKAVVFVRNAGPRVIHGQPDVAARLGDSDYDDAPGSRVVAGIVHQDTEESVD
jgi:hypothetical protein